MRVLLVEDEAKAARFVKKGLEEEGLAVDVARDGEEALSLAETGPYDLLILDLMLPRGDGLHVLRTLRSKGNGIPVLILTARNSVGDKIQGFELGADDYLTKPFAFGELVARVKNLLRRRSPAGPVTLQIGNLRLDPSTRTARVGEQTVELRNKEYTLLEYFMRNPNRILTRTMIAEHVWDYHFDSETNLIDVYVNLLRKKVDPTKRLIQTVRGVGYVMKG